MPRENPDRRYLPEWLETLNEEQCEAYDKWFKDMIDRRIQRLRAPGLDHSVTQYHRGAIDVLEFINNQIVKKESDG